MESSTPARTSCTRWRSVLPRPLTPTPRFCGATSPTSWKSIPKGAHYSLQRALVGGTVYVGAPDGYIFALHPENGETLWSFQAGGNVKGRPALIDGSVFFRSEDGSLYALDAANGELLWQYETDLAPYRVLANNGVIFVNTEGSHIYALESRDRQHYLA